MANDKTFLNLYWSFRKYVYQSFPTVPTYWNPLTRPSITAEKFLVVRFQDDFIGKMSFSYPRIFCVAVQDPEEIKVTELVSAVIEKFASQGSALRTFSLYNHDTDTVIGHIGVRDVKARPAFPYSEGYVHRAVDMTLKYQVEQRHL
jgi:hypothetical protein